MNNPYQRPEMPKNSLTLLKWVVFEPLLLDKYGETLSMREKALSILNAYQWVVLLSLILYASMLLLIVGLDLPHRFPDQFQNHLVESWRFGEYLTNAFFYFKETFWGLALGLALALAVSLAVGLALGLAGGLTLGFAVGFAVGFGGSFPGGLAVGLVVGLAGGLAFGFGVGLVGDFALGLDGGLAFGLAFYIAYFRLLFYPFYYSYSSLRCNFRRNPYLRDALIWLPLPRVERTLLAESWKDPDMGLQLSRFLFEYRPLQQKLAFRIVHAATAALWFYHPLKTDQFKAKIPPHEAPRLGHVMPSSGWFKALEAARDDLITAEKQTHQGLKKESWERFHMSLCDFEEVTLRQLGSWKMDYLKAIRRWITESEKALERMTQDLKTIEPITRNIYRIGESLRPGQFGAQTFTGRADLRDKLSISIRSSPVMPTFLLQGQRRVGKTSLLNFLPELLGHGFLVIIQDMQSDEFRTVSDCFSGFLKRIGEQLEVDVKEKSLPQNPMDAWRTFRAFLEEISMGKDRKIILAFDEYENFHKFLKGEGDIGDDLLGAMRSFSQHQNQVVLLFTGLYLFSDLGEPDLSRYFVHTYRLKVDYLKQPYAEKLITRPYEGFNLVYPPELVAKIWHLTRGHPALLQHIGFEMVNRANTKMKKQMTADDLEAVLDEKVLDRDNAVMVTFWHHFCDDSLKETVRQIMAGKTPSCKKDLLRLVDYGFVIKENNSLRLRVPLFEQWIKQHGESF
jgi:hypothetical protein